MTAQTDRSASNLANKLPHLTPDEVHSLQRMVDRLIDAYHPRQIYLFGSKVRVDSGPNSDFDLLVVVDYKVSRERKGSRLAYHALRGTGTAADVLVWTILSFLSRV
ncbi:MAG: nucleotidyltransferase domain-containing protein, partial [Chloroflexota bacterium]